MLPRFGTSTQVIASEHRWSAIFGQNGRGNRLQTVIGRLQVPARCEEPDRGLSSATSRYHWSLRLLSLVADHPSVKKKQSSLEERRLSTLRRPVGPTPLGLRRVRMG
jgi:hypothetical protein